MGIDTCEYCLSKYNKSPAPIYVVDCINCFESIFLCRECFDLPFENYICVGCERDLKIDKLLNNV